MKISEIRIYAEVLEQGIDFNNYVHQAGFEGNIINVYTKKMHGEFSENDSIIDRIRKVKDVDVLISAISENNEYPLLMIEYSTAVPTDDHKMQRSDVYYWSSIFQVPMMKISPSTKGMDQQFGGGAKITNEKEQFLAFHRGALFFPIKWNTPDNENVLPTKEKSLSCIPYSNKIEEIVRLIIVLFVKNKNIDVFYKELINYYSNTYREILDNTSLTDVRNSIVNSTRFHWYNEKLSVKINRFGHAMDPDRGVLYFVNMIVGAQNTITEIQVNRPDDISARGGYNALFDALTNKAELINYVTSIINNSNNIFTDDDALYVLTHGLNIENSIQFERISEHQYKIKDETLRSFLLTHNSVVAKTIFFLSTKLKLTDKNRNTICTIVWNQTPIFEYLNNIKTTNKAPIVIQPLSLNKAKEDIITFASVELYKKLNYDLLAVSYPGAQGDRCILTGSGRNVLRTYIDIIAYKKSAEGIQVFLEECKDLFSKSQSDIEKLNNILNSDIGREGVKNLFQKVINQDQINEIYISIAAKEAVQLQRFLIDYIFMFNVSYDENYTYIDYTVAVINTNLVTKFSPLENNGRLAGRMKFKKIYIIE